MDEDVVCRERKKGGIIEERVFCPVRWGFSKRLPGIIADLHGKLCLSGGSKEIFYRQEDLSPKDWHSGWYICIRLGASDQHKNLTLSVRSAHYRTNRPNDVRGGSKRFYALLASFYKSEKMKREWL